MAEESADDKTEEATARRLEKAREEGQIPRSQELGGAAVMITAMAALYLTGPWMMNNLSGLVASGFVFDRKDIFAERLMPLQFAEFGLSALMLIVPILGLTVIVAILATSLMGGLNFSWKAIEPKPSKLSPIEGFKRMFGMKALVELLKAILKFLLVASVLLYFMWEFSEELIALGQMAFEPAMAAAGEIIGWTTLMVTATLVVIAAIDVPYQNYEFYKRMRMTKQEVKDEFKDVEGRPEVKAKIRQRQREMAEQRMMQQVKEADVIITNPEHFAVALVYDPESDGAPIVIAKGIDHLALRIRNEGSENGIPQVETPPLARALYYTTEVDQAIPEDLYYAVAQVIAYVFSLSSVRRDGRMAEKPNPEIPPEYQFDTDGNRQA